MMLTMLWMVIALTLVFGVVVAFGAPYLPTLPAQRISALKLLDLKKDQTLLELGAGDGGMTLLALKNGLKVTAVELNPILCVIIYIRTIRYRSKVTIKCANFWRTDWGEYDGVYVFLLDKYMDKLDKYIIQDNKRPRLASYAFKIPKRAIIDQNNGVFLYDYGV